MTKRTRIKCPDCTRFYCIEDGCCGSGADGAIRMASMQGGSGSPNVGLIPTMRKITIE